jgi:hypothetical protein
MFFLLFSPFFVSISVATINVQIIGILPYDFGVVSAVVWTGAAFDLAVQAANKKYSPFLNVSLRFIYNTSHRNCEDISGDAVKGLSELYYTQTEPTSVYAIVASGER